MIPGLTAPAPQFGRTGLLPASVKHFALSSAFQNIGGVYYRDPYLFGARTGLQFQRARLRGDAAAYVIAGTDKPGAFQPICSLKHDGKIYLGGRLTDDGSNARAVLFVAATSANPVWEMVTTGLEGPKGTGGYRGIVGIAAKGSQIVALSSTGEIAVSDDGAAFAAYPNIGFTGAANALAGGEAGFFAVGANGIALSAADPKGAWTARTSTFGTAAVLTALCIGTLFVIAGGARLATANGLANFTARSLPGGAYVDLLAGVPGRFFAGGSETWLTATDGAAWSAPSDNPYKGAATRPRAAYKADGRWVVHWADGNISVSENDADWTKIDSPGLPAQPFTVAWAL